MTPPPPHLLYGSCTKSDEAYDRLVRVIAALFLLRQMVNILYLAGIPAHLIMAMEEAIPYIGIATCLHRCELLSEVAPACF